MEIIICILLAMLPAFMWAYIFYKKDEVYKPKALQTFLLGMSCVVPLLLYKWSWAHLPSFNVFTYTDGIKFNLLQFTEYMYLPLGIVFAFLFVGVMEEWLKMLVVKKVDRGFFRNIDDAIEFAIMSALGFAFVENILYFYYIWTLQGFDFLMVTFAFRSIFSTFAHILFSGIFGYFYGIAYFADPIWAEQQRKKRHAFVNLIHRLFNFKKDRVYAMEKVSEGLILAVFLHAGFNILLELQLTFFMVPFLFIGYLYLDYLFKQKENLKAYGYLLGQTSPLYAHNIVWLHTSPEVLRKLIANKK